MDTASIAATAVSMTQAKTQASLQAIMLKKQHEAQMALIDMIGEAASNQGPPPSGMGQIVDKTA